MINMISRYPTVVSAENALFSIYKDNEVYFTKDVLIGNYNQKPLYHYIYML